MRNVIIDVIEWIEECSSDIKQLTLTFITMMLEKFLYSLNTEKELAKKIIGVTIKILSITETILSLPLTALFWLIKKTS